MELRTSQLGFVPCALTWDSVQTVPPFVDRATKACTTLPEFEPAAVLPGGRLGEYDPSALESWNTTDRAPAPVVMSGKNWCHVADTSTGTAGAVQVTPSVEVRANTFD